MYKLAVIMDPIKTINHKKDTTCAILLQAQKHNWDTYYIEQQNLFCEDGIVYAKAKKILIHENQTLWYEFLDQTEIYVALFEFDVVFMRKDPPVDEDYIYTCQLLNIAKNNNNAFIINNPSSLICNNEKLFITRFKDCYPPSFISTNKNLIINFINENQTSVLKSLKSYGGTSIFKVTKNDPNLNVIIETLTNNGTRQIIVQKYINDVEKTGDKRILLIDGEPIPYALARIPNNLDFRANLAKGGIGKGVKLTKQDLFLCKRIGPTLKMEGLLFVGLDIIGNYISEINITSPTCVKQIEHIFKINICKKLLDCIKEKIQQKVNY